MDLARLSSVAYPSASYPVSNRARERVLELVTEVDAAKPAPDVFERVVQGEVLQRQRTEYSATQDYLRGRLYESANSAGNDAAPQQRSSASRSSAMVGAYLSHTRELIQPDIGRGKQIDYFI